MEADHKTLQWIEKMKDTTGRITGWYPGIQPFGFIINHISGEDNCSADSERFKEGKCVMAAVTAKHIG